MCIYMYMKLRYKILPLHALLLYDVMKNKFAATTVKMFNII